mmetsp:Transcript_20925/g.65067  ORF Transcript_20925/g.65067 Transcript_20925/m.65067 type:complete len:399 (-) Transcript_20925:36-1232(-)
MLRADPVGEHDCRVEGACADRRTRLAAQRVRHRGESGWGLNALTMAGRGGVGEHAIVRGEGSRDVVALQQREHRVERRPPVLVRRPHHVQPLLVRPVRVARGALGVGRCVAAVALAVGALRRRAQHLRHRGRLRRPAPPLQQYQVHVPRHDRRSRHLAHRPVRRDHRALRGARGRGRGVVRNCCSAVAARVPLQHRRVRHARPHHRQRLQRRAAHAAHRAPPRRHPARHRQLALRRESIHRAQCRRRRTARVRHARPRRVERRQHTVPVERHHALLRAHRSLHVLHQQRHLARHDGQRVRSAVAGSRRVQAHEVAAQHAHVAHRHVARGGAGGGATVGGAGHALAHRRGLPAARGSAPTSVRRVVATRATAGRGSGLGRVAGRFARKRERAQVEVIVA